MAIRRKPKVSPVAQNPAQRIVDEAKAAYAARHVQARVRRCLVVDDSRMIRKVAHMVEVIE